jgi:hypothetical protein
MKQGGFTTGSTSWQAEGLGPLPAGVLVSCFGWNVLLRLNRCAESMSFLFKDVTFCKCAEGLRCNTSTLHKLALPMQTMPTRVFVLPCCILAGWLNLLGQIAGVSAVAFLC